MTPELTSQLFDLSLMLLTAVVTGLIIPSIYKLGKLATLWLESKTHSAAFACASEKLTTLVAESVQDIEQTFVKKMKDRGQWDENAAAAARDAAYEGVLRSLGSEGLREVMGCLKLDSTGLSQRLHQMIESFIQSSK